MTTYDTDFYLWSKEQSSLLREKEYTKLDIENLIEEIESLGRSEKWSLTRDLTKYFTNKFKILYKNEETRKLNNTIKMLCIQTKRQLNENPTLKEQLTEILDHAFEDARYQIAIDLDMELETFTEKRLWKVQDIFDDIEDKYRE